MDLSVLRPICVPAPCAPHVDLARGIAPKPPLTAKRSFHLPVVACGVALAHDVANRRRQVRSQKRCGRCATRSNAHAGTQCYTIVPIEGKGLGVLAARDISAGEMVAEEVPFIRFKSDDPTEAVRQRIGQQFERLPADKQEAVMALHDAGVLREEKSLEGIILSSAFDGGLAPTIARFNHSCVPNCEQSWDSDETKIRVFATMDVRAGDELTIFYTDIRELRDHRFNLLWNRYRFRCVCPACSAEPGGDEARSKMLSLNQDIASSGKSNPQRGIKMVSDLLELYEKEQITPKTYHSMACFQALEFALAAGDHAEAKLWAERSCRFSRVSLGAEHMQTQQLLTYAKQLGSTMVV